MARELKHAGGVGNNTEYRVIEDGKAIGFIRRNGNSGFDVRGHYYRRVAFGKTMAIAKAKAMEATFPTVQEAYELECEDAYRTRKKELENQFTRRLYALTRDLVAGSNSARQEIEELLDGIEKAARCKAELPRSETDMFKVVVMGEAVHPPFRYPKRPEEYSQLPP